LFKVTRSLDEENIGETRLDSLTENETNALASFRRWDDAGMADASHGKTCPRQVICVETFAFYCP